MSTLRTIHLHGFLGKKYAKKVELAGDNVFQIMSGLEHRYGQEFMEDVRVNEWHLTQGPVKPGNDISEEDLKKDFKLTAKVIHLLPAVRGANNALSIIVGIILVVVGVFTYNPYLIGAGVAMALGGAIMMAMTPEVGGPEQAADDKGSKVFNGAVNITSQGGPIPLVYGRHGRVSSVVISTDFSSDRVG